MFKHTHKTKIILIFVVLGIGFFPGNGRCASVAGKVRDGNKFYEKGDYPASIDQYEEALKKDSESDVVNYNLGTAYYKSGEYSKAMEHLQKSLLSENKELGQKAHFNLGNSLYKSGIGQEKNNLDSAIDLLERSLVQFEDILKQETKDPDAQANYDFVKKELERLKKKKEHQQQQKQDHQKDQDQNKENQQQSQSNDSRDQSQQQDQQDQSNHNNPSSENKKDDRSSGPNEQKGEEKEQNYSQDNGKSSDGEYNNKNKAESLSGNAKVMTEQEAKDLLETYGQTEEPKGLLNFQPKKSGTQPVLKDW